MEKVLVYDDITSYKHNLYSEKIIKELKLYGLVNADQ